MKCEEFKLNTPEDVKVVFFFNLKTSVILNPSITKITQPVFEMGREAAEIAFRLIEKKSIKLFQKTQLGIQN
jgi:LacI family transcriptional regulator